MAEKILNNMRIINKHDTEANWLKATGFIPKKGELIVYDKDSTYNYERFKIGDGTTVVSSLPFADANKVDKVSGKGLSTNDYTTTEKNKLAGIADGANKTVIDSALSSSSTNPVQNKVVNTAISNLNDLIGGTKVSEQINTAIANKSDVGHNHDDKYYTESEIDNKLSGKSDSNHTHSAYVNQNAFSKVAIGSATIEADSVTDTLTLVAGSNITLTPDTSGDKVTIAATDTVYTHPNSGVTAGTYKSVTVNAQGHVTAGTNPTTLSDYGIIDAMTKDEIEDAITSARAYTNAKIEEWVGDETVSDQIASAIDGISSSWYDIENKPFSEGDYTITWDGNKSGKEYVTTIYSNTFYKVSDDILMMFDITNENTTLGYFDVRWEQTTDKPISLSQVVEKDGAVIIGDYEIFSIPNDNMTVETNWGTLTFPSSGIYFLDIPESLYVEYLTITNATGKISSKVLPKGLMSKSEFDKHVNNRTWKMLYDSGAITKNVNSFYWYDISGYTKIKIALKCVNVAESAGVAAGSVNFQSKSGGSYYRFSTLFPNLISNASGTSAAMAEFSIVDGFIVCENALRSTNAPNMFSTAYNQGEWSLTSVGGGLIVCPNPVGYINVAVTNNSESHFYGAGSRLIIWGCKE